MPRSLAALLALPLVLAPASAQEITRAYVQVHGGAFAPFGDELTVRGVGAADEPISADIDLDPKVGFAAGGILGYEVALGLAVEAEVTFRSNAVSPGVDALPAVFPTPPTGDAETTAIMLNAVYELDVPLLADPYVGAGLGYLTPVGDFDAFDGELAYQAKAGLAWPVGVGSLITEVNYLGTNGLETGEGADAEVDYGGLGARLGYRFGF